MSRIEKIMLIHPPDRAVRGFFRANLPPLGLAYLAAMVRDEAEVKILDAKCEGYDHIEPMGENFLRFGLPMSEIRHRIEQFAPDIVGVSCVISFNWPDVAHVLRLAKDVNPDIVTTVGGTHPTFLAEDVMRDHPELDYIVMGEGERTFLDMVRRLKAGKSLDDLPGIAERKGADINIHPPAEPILDIDSLPLPARDLLPMEKYFDTAVPFSRTYKHRRNTQISTSRGCPARCIFCSSANYWGHRWRGRSAQNVLDEIRHLIDQYGIKEIQFIDDNLTLERNRAETIFRGIIDRGYDIAWNTPNGIALWRMDEELLKLMKASGCYELTLAFESGDQHVLRNIVGKPLDLDRAAYLTRVIKKMGFATHAFFISGFPGETLDQVKNTFDYAKKVDVDSAYFFLANPLPGTELYETASRKGYLRPEFKFTNIDYSIPYLETPEWSAEEIGKAVSRQYFIHNIRLLWRSPLKFWHKYGGTIIEHPGMVLSHLKLGERIPLVLDKLARQFRILTGRRRPAVEE